MKVSPLVVPGGEVERELDDRFLRGRPVTADHQLEARTECSMGLMQVRSSTQVVA